MTSTSPLVVLYEHPHWFKPLFTALTQRGIPYDALHADGLRLDPHRRWATGEAPSLVFNRMSPSAWTRGQGSAVTLTGQALRHWEASGIATFNGRAAYELETSKVLQASLIRRLGLPVPRTIAVHGPDGLIAAAAQLEPPFVVKPNVGGSGAGIARFDSVAELRDAVADPVDSGLGTSPDGVLLVQEYHPPKGRAIHRIETLEGRFLYAIRIGLGDGAGFDLCPADICKSAKGETLTTEACPAGAQKQGLTVEAAHLPSRLVQAAEQIARAASLDVGGIELLESERDGLTYFYDVNALSNFVADATRVVGFDPTERLVDALSRRLGLLSPGRAGRSA